MVVIQTYHTANNNLRHNNYLLLDRHILRQQSQDSNSGESSVVCSETQAVFSGSNSNNNEMATEEQLKQLTLAKLKELASKHDIQGRSTMTKNLASAHKLLVPKLVGLVVVDEI